MLRQIIKIDDDKCNGCGICVSACHEGAIGLENGKAKLLRDDYCDGLGNCLPACPTNAITFEQREADEYDNVAVKLAQEAKKATENENSQSQKIPCSCPGTHSKKIERNQSEVNTSTCETTPQASQLNQWPVQIQLVPVNAAYFENANLLIAADCTAYSYGDFHNKFMKNKITLIGCPKLDEGEYSEKLTAILSSNNIRSITVVRMEVPCCGGIVNAVTTALKNSGKIIPWQVVTISTSGNTIE